MAATKMDGLSKEYLMVLDLEHALDVACGAARRAGEVISDRMGRMHQVEYKGAVDLVTEADGLAEEVIAATLSQAFPQAELLLEESGLHEGQSAGKGGRSAPALRWVVDPLDGTTNFSHGFPVFAVSIALEVDGVVQVGVVLDVPHNHLYHAVVGGGAWGNGRALKVSETPRLEHALLATGFPYDRRVSLDNNVDRFTAFMKTAQGIRRMGSAAMDLIWVATGALDGYWESKLKPWDTSAGALIVTEAGGVVTNFDGGRFVPQSGRVMASNGRIHEEMIEVLRRVEGVAGRLNSSH